MTHLALTCQTPSGARAFNIECFSFPGGERHVRLPAEEMEAADSRDWTIEARVYTPAEIMDLLLATDAVRRVIPAGSRLCLLMPYVPYARQDRAALEGEPLSAKVFDNLINALNFDQVEIWDPHSDVTGAMLNNVRIRRSKELLQAAFDQKGAGHLLRECAFVAPDAGAHKRVAKLAEKFGTAVVFAEKERDLATGRISGTRVQGDLPQKPLLIVDDICDGGWTFIELARVLRAKTSQPLYLYVTHGLFTKGLDPLKACYDGVFSANCRDAAIDQQLGIFQVDQKAA